MSTAVVILSPGFEEIEAITIIDILRRGGVEVTVAGLENGLISGSHNIPVQPDVYYRDIVETEFDMLILPGGQPGTENLKKDTRLLKWVEERSRHKGKIAAICAAPTVLQKAGIAGGLKVTSYPTEKAQFKDSEYLEDDVVKDKNIITSRGVGTAIEFSLALVSELAGAQKAAEVREKILYHSK
jgi:4-methyl-5(b-hydroxyethyl)-thiazole monophosphate biosynthesis